jgi:tRNA (guanine37-N1)-methyltransferase
VVGPPLYTRPAQWDGEAVPGVLLSGNHARIRAWREREARERARTRETGEGSTWSSSLSTHERSEHDNE